MTEEETGAPVTEGHDTDPPERETLPHQPGADRFVGPTSRPAEYELIARVARGGEGFVWHARYRGTLPRSVDFAIKQFIAPADAQPSDWPSPALVDRWDEQLKLLHLVHHEHLVGYKELFSGWPPHAAEAGERSYTREPPPDLRSWYLVMDWVDGPTLHEVIRSGHLSPAERVDLIAQVADAVDHLHSGAGTQGMALLHRDIKPGNVIVNPSRGAVLVDLGLLRVEEPAMTEMPMWTGPYLAPEVHANKARSSRASDSWSLAATAFFALTGEHPSPMDSDVMRRQLGDALEGRARQPEAVIDVLMSVLDQPPEARPPTTSAWATRLRDAVSDTPSGRVDAVVGPRAAPAAHDRRTDLGGVLGLLATAAVAIAAVIAVILVVFTSGGGGRKASTGGRASGASLQINGTGTFTEDGPNVSGTGTESITPLGTATFSFTSTFSSYPNPAPPCSPGPGTPTSGHGEGTTSNGDVLRTSFSGLACQSGVNSLGYNIFELVGTYTVTGGTGRLNGATGHGTMRARSEFLNDMGGSISIANNGTLHLAS